MKSNQYEITLAGVTLRVTGTYTKAVPEVRYLRNGDPGYPAEPEDFEAEKVELLPGIDAMAPIDITDLLELDLSDVEEAVLEQMDREGDCDGPDED